MQKMPPDVASLKESILRNLVCVQGKFPAVATLNDRYLAVAYTVRDHLLERWTRAAQTYFEKTSRTVCYLSAEFLLGPHLENNLVCMGLMEPVRLAVTELGWDLPALIAQEEEPGLGNGGLGRLAACFMDSLATLDIPAIGYGIRYEFGIFDQEIRNGWQVESTDKWLRCGYPWEIARPEVTFDVLFGGHTQPYTDDDGKYRVRWVADRAVKGIAYDTAIVGYATPTASLLRLWKAEACESFHFGAFNVGDYYGAVHQKMVSENITKVLYPNDEPASGKQLRLEQQYFFTSCALQDMIRIHLQREPNLDRFHEKYAVQLNDTHPAIAVAELMRLLVDVHRYDWDRAWAITTRTFAYTNHTLLPEALERWPVRLFGSLLPRHMEVLFEINRRFLDEVAARFPDDGALRARLSLIDETGDRYVRMAHLACVGSHSVNGVAALHSDLLKKDVLRDFHAFWPEKFNNKTNGVTPRRFLAVSNPSLRDLITSRIGDGWIKDLDQLRGLEAHAEDPELQAAWRRSKRTNKEALSALVKQRCGVAVDPDSLFDVQAKRIHEYKRQHLNVLHVVSLYLRMKRGGAQDACPRTVLFGGKAAPGYFMAKRIIKLINSVADVVNVDPDVRGRLKVAFLPDFNVRLAHRVYPAADLSEQISTAGKEASGTGNMKFSLNGALTIGTLDGANVEIREHVGAENFFLFGLTVEEVERWRSSGYDPRGVAAADPHLSEVLDAIGSGLFCPDDRGLFKPVVDSLLYHDEYMLLADFRSYIDAQDAVSRLYRAPRAWTRMSILNVARMGFFSSDRTIAEYCRDVWNVKPVGIE